MPPRYSHFSSENIITIPLCHTDIVDFNLMFWASTLHQPFPKCLCRESSATSPHQLFLGSCSCTGFCSCTVLIRVMFWRSMSLRLDPPLHYLTIIDQLTLSSRYPFYPSCAWTVLNRVLHASARANQLLAFICHVLSLTNNHDKEDITGYPHNILFADYAPWSVWNPVAFHLSTLLFCPFCLSHSDSHSQCHNMSYTHEYVFTH